MKIDYFKKKLKLPLWARYVATDKAGVITAFEQEPELRLRGGYWAPVGYSEFQEIGVLDLTYRTDSFWSNSLIEYEIIEEISKIRTSIKHVIRDNKFAFEHIIKICCYIGNTANVNAKRDLLKHIRDAAGGLSNLNGLCKSEPILKNRGEKYLLNLLTAETENSFRPNFFREISREYTKLEGWELEQKINDKIRPAVGAIYAKIAKSLIKNRDITMSLFRNILEETKTFEYHELNSIFRNYKDID